MCEEYLTDFGPAMSRLFDLSWSDKTFLMTCFVAKRQKSGYPLSIVSNISFPSINVISLEKFAEL
jgi:hypothetical protein